jgi:deazaflavin-dependent oxidoreductase (nitroreductase family)
VADHFLYLTTVGRTSGLPRQIEIWFVEHDGRYYIVSERREQSGWVKNIRSEPRVHFSVGTRSQPGAAVPSTAGRARVVTEGDEPALVAAIKSLMDRRYGWSDGLIVELSPEAAPRSPTSPSPHGQ